MIRYIVIVTSFIFLFSCTGKKEKADWDELFSQQNPDNSQMLDKSQTPDAEASGEGELDEDVAQTCQDECSAAGVKECVSNTTFSICGQFDSYTCLELGDEQSCQEGHKCSAGSCIKDDPECVEEASTRCMDGDLYYYDSCDNPGAKSKECGVSAEEGTPFCRDGNLYIVFAEKGCDSDGCYENRSETIYEECNAGCRDRACLDQCVSECSGKQCGDDGCGRDCGSCNIDESQYCSKEFVCTRYECTERCWEMPFSYPEDPEQRFAVSNDGDKVVTDSYTSLQWIYTVALDKDYQAALDYCDTLEYGGMNDWRLPTRHELETLINYKKIIQPQTFRVWRACGCSQQLNM